LANMSFSMGRGSARSAPLPPVRRAPSAPPERSSPRRAPLTSARSSPPPLTGRLHGWDRKLVDRLEEALGSPEVGAAPLAERAVVGERAVPEERAQVPRRLSAHHEG